MWCLSGLFLDFSMLCLCFDWACRCDLRVVLRADVRFHPVLPQWHVKDPGHSSKSGSGRLHLNSQTPLTQRSRSGLTMPLSRRSLGTYSGNELTRNSSGNTQPQSSQQAEPLWTDPGVNIGISVRELIPTFLKKEKKKKKKQAGNEWSNILPKSSQARNKPTLPR